MRSTASIKSLNSAMGAREMDVPSGETKPTAQPLPHWKKRKESVANLLSSRRAQSIMSLKSLDLNAAKSKTEDKKKQWEETYGNIEPTWTAKDENDASTLVHFENFPSNRIDSRHLDIWLPPSYKFDENGGALSDQKYPVLYAHDGQNLFDPSTSFGGEDWQVQKTVMKLSAMKKIPEIIIVGIWNTGKRIPEYMPQRPYERLKARTDDESKEILEQYDSRYANFNPENAKPCSDAYLEFIVDELKPFIDQNFNTLSDQRNTYMMGSSMGGLITLYALCEYPNVFFGGACVSTHWPILSGETVEYLKNEKTPKHDKEIPDPSNHRIYFDFGTGSPDDQYEPFQQQVDQLMTNKGYKWAESWYTEKFVGDDHSERCWRTRVYLPLLFLLSDSPVQK